MSSVYANGCGPRPALRPLRLPMTTVFRIDAIFIVTSTWENIGQVTAALNQVPNPQNCGCRFMHYGSTQHLAGTESALDTSSYKKFVLRLFDEFCLSYIALTTATKRQGCSNIPKCVPFLFEPFLTHRLLALLQTPVLGNAIICFGY